MAVAGVEVFVSSPGHTPQISDLDGYFSFSDLPKGRYTLVARKDDLFANVPVLVEASMASLLVQMRDSGVVVLTVVDSEMGSLISGAMVKDRELGGRTVATADDGRATLRGMGSGLQSFEVTASGYAPTRTDLVIGADRETILRTIALSRPTSVTGRVLSPSGAPVPGASVRVDRHDNAWSESAQVDNNGSWRFDTLAPGDYSIHARSARFGLTEPIAVELDGMSSVSGLVLQYKERPSVGGVVLARDGAGVAKVSVFLLRDHSAGGLSGETDAVGAFRLEGVPSGESTMFAIHGERASALVRISIDRVARTDMVLTLEDGMIEGVVEDEARQPLRDKSVRVSGGGLLMALFESQTTTNPQGLFRLGPLPVGDYDLVVSNHTVRARTGRRDLTITLPSHPVEEP